MEIDLIGAYLQYKEISIMKIRIKKHAHEQKEPDLLVFPDEEEPGEYVKVSKELINEILEVGNNLLVESEDDVANYCNKHDFYKLKDILIKLNYLSMASKGKLNSK